MNKLRLYALIGAALLPLSNANAWTPVHPGASAKLGPSLPKDPAPSTAQSGSPSAEKAATSTKATIDKLNQSQGGLLNQQTNDTGSSRSTGKAAQSQNGALNKQERKVAIASDGGKAEVSEKDVVQWQRGTFNDQKVHIGNAEK